MIQAKPMPLDEFRRRLGAVAEDRSEAELLRWRSLVDWIARAAIDASRSAGGRISRGGTAR